MKKEKKIPAKRAFFWIGCSLLFVTGSVLLGGVIYLYRQKQQMVDPAYAISTFVLEEPSRDPLKGSYLAELLDLSEDQPTNINQFQIEYGEKKLSESPVIKQAKIHKIPPSALYISYSVREPIAYLGNFQNAALDREGVLFPVIPYFTPKKIPKIYLSSHERKWGEKIEGEEIDLALSLLEKLQKFPYSKGMEVMEIDVSNSFSESLGKREIMVRVEEKSEREENGRSILSISPRFIRISTQNVRNALENYLVLREYLWKEEEMETISTNEPLYVAPATVIDLRVPKIGYYRKVYGKNG